MTGITCYSKYYLTSITFNVTAKYGRYQKFNVYNCNYAFVTNYFMMVTGDYDHIMIIITHQLLVCYIFLLSLYYNIYLLFAFKYL